MSKNKAAMFGLDARIALAIFGALSIITGASLYSVLEETNTIAILNQLTELSKAYEQRYLDTRKELPFIDFGNLNAAALVDGSIDNTKKWKGPYINYTPVKIGSSTINAALKNTDGSLILFSKQRSSVWTAFTIDGTKCLGISDCSIWVRFDKPDTFEDTAKALDKKIDNSVGELTGRLRYIKSGGTLYLFLKFKNTRDLSTGTKIY